MYRCSFVDDRDGQTRVFYMCESHVYLVLADAGLSIAPVQSAPEECAECQSMQASYESERRAERRNEEILGGYY